MARVEITEEVVSRTLEVYTFGLEDRTDEHIETHAMRKALQTVLHEVLPDIVGPLEAELAEKKAEFTRMENAWRGRVSRLERGYSGMPRQKTGYGEEPHEAN